MLEPIPLVDPAAVDLELLLEEMTLDDLIADIAAYDEYELIEN